MTKGYFVAVFLYYLSHSHPFEWISRLDIVAVGGHKGRWGKLGNSDFQVIPVFYLNDQIIGIFNNTARVFTLIF